MQAQKLLKCTKLVATPGNFAFWLLCRRMLVRDSRGLGGEPALSTLTPHPPHSLPCSLCRCMKAACSRKKKKARHSSVCLQTAGTPLWPIQCETSFVHSIFEILPCSLHISIVVLQKKCVSFNKVLIPSERTPTYSLCSFLLCCHSLLIAARAFCFHFKWNDRLAT